MLVAPDNLIELVKEQIAQVLLNQVGIPSLGDHHLV